MTRLVSAIWILLFAGVLVARGQQVSDSIADAAKADMIESVLDVELRSQSSLPGFANIRLVSSANIEFIDPSRLSAHGFKLVPAKSLAAAKKDHVVEYLLFRKIFFANGVALVVASRVTEGRPCFAPPFSRESHYTYESRRTSAGWVTRLIGGPASSLSFALKRFSSPR